MIPGPHSELGDMLGSVIQIAGVAVLPHDLHLDNDKVA
jgi:hypothetical protein